MLKTRVKNALKKHINLKINLNLVAQFMLPSSGDSDYKNFTTPNVVVINEHEIDEMSDQLFERILTDVCMSKCLFFYLNFQ